MSMSLKVNIVGTGQTKTFRFSPEMTVSEVCSLIREKTNEGGEDHGLFQQGIEGKTVSRWLTPEKTLQFYDINNDSVLDYKKKHRPQKIKLLDETIKTQLIDESTTVSEIVSIIAKKMGIKNPEEYSLQKEGGSGEWLKNNQILSEQGILDTDILMLKKKFFFNDANIDRNDPVQLHLLYVQCRDAIIEAKYPTQREEAIQLAALQSQVAMGDFNPAKHVGGYLVLKEYLPLQWAKSKNAEKDIYKEYRKLVNMSEVNAKYRYVQLCRSLKTYGMTSFLVKMKPKDGNKKKPIDMTLGITRESMILMVDETKEVVKSHPLKHIRRWAATDKSFTFDFGDHDEEYCVLMTDKPEEISNLIAGYIDIIMKSRRDATKYTDKEETGIAIEETIAVKRGTAASTSTFNYGGPGGNGGGQYIAPSQQIPITDLKSALRATDLLISELNAMRGSGASGSVPQNFTRSFTTLTPQQYKHQLISHANAISTAASTLLSEMSTPQPGGMSMTHQSIIKRAQIMMAEMSTVGSCAKNAAFVPELASFSDEIIGVATKLSEAMSKLLSSAVTISDKPLDDAGKTAAQQHVFATNALAVMMMAAVDNQYVTESSSQLLLECVKSVASASNLLVQLGDDKCQLIDDEILHTQVENSLSAMRLQSDQLLTVTENISTTACHPDSRKLLDGLCEATKLKASSLLTSFKSSDIPDQDINNLQVRVQDVLETLSMVSHALDCVEQRPSNAASMSEDILNLSSDVLTEEFSNLSNDLTNSISLLRNNLNNSPESILESFKVIASNANRLISCTKAVASRADLPTQQRLYTSTNAVFESVSHLSNTCRRLVANIGDAEASTTVIDAAGHLQTLTQNMSVDAGKLASIVALRDCSKDMIAHVAHLVSTARLSSEHLPDAASVSLVKASKEVTDAISKLMIGLKRVNQSDVKSESAQMELLELSQKQSMPPMNLVSTSKRLAPKITDPNHKQRLLYDSDAASTAVQRLMRTCEAYKRICGHAEIEESLEVFDSTMSELETLEIAIQGGFVDTVPGQTRDSTTEMLLVAVKSLNQTNAELVAEVRTNPARLGELVKAVTSATSQVAFASKAVIGTTPGKVPQKKLLAAVKQMNIDMQQLVRASRAVATNPGDASSDLLLDGAESDVSSTIASLVAASTHIDCKELDEATIDINNHQAKLGQLGSATNESFQTHSEEIQSSIKAINAAIAQTVSMARAKNIKGLGASAKILASSINTLVAVANNASVTCQSEQMQTAILSNTTSLCGTAITLLDYSKARVANAKDPVYDQNLVHCSKTMEDFSNKILRAIGSGSNGICDESVDIIVQATTKLDETVHPEIGDGIIVVAGGALAMSQQQSLLTLTNAAKQLGKYTSDIVTSSRRANIDQLGEHSMTAAKVVVEMIDSARAVLRAAVSSAPPDISLPSKAILDATAIMSASAGQDLPAIVGAARTIASSTTQLFGVSKEKVANEEDEVLKAQLVKSTQQLATATSNLAKSVKAVTAKEPGAVQQLDTSIRELESATMSLLIASGDANDHMKEFERLVGVCRSASSTTAQVIQAAASSSMKPKDSELQTHLNESALSMSSAIKDVLKVSSLMMPGVMLCEEAIDMVQRSIGDLSTMSLSVAVGTPFEGGANGLTHLECQEQMVEITKSIGKGINDLLKASRQSPEAIGQSTRALGYTAPHLATSTKSSLSTTTDQDAQSRIVSESKNLGDSILRLCQASLAASSNPSKETYQNIVAKCNEASEAMNKLVAQISSGVNLYRDLDESIDAIKSSVGRLQDPVTKDDTTKSYQDYKEKITTLTKDLAIALKNVIATDPNNLVQVSTISKDIASFVTQIAENVAMVTTQSSGGDQKVKDAILTNVKQVINSTAQIIDISKQASQGNSTGTTVSHNESFKVASDGITRFLQSIKQGSIGEIQCDAAVESIKKMICDIDAYSLFAAAGQLESNTSVANRQHYLRTQVQKDVVGFAKLLIVSGSQLVGSSKGSQENLGVATSKFAEQVTQLVGSAKEVASSLRDTQSQQDVLSATKALSISCQQLVLAGKDAQRFQKDSTAFRSLGKAAEGVAEAVGQLISSVYVAINEAGKGIKELEKASVVITSYIDKPDTVLTNHKATPATYVQSIRDVSKASIDIVTSYQSNQDDLVKSSQQLVSSVQSMVGQTKGAVLLFDQQEKNPDAVKLQTLVKEANQSIVTLIGHVKEQEEGVTSPLVSESSRKLSEKLHSLVQASKLIPGGKDLVLEEDQQEDLELTAENELNSLAKTIEAATQSLLAARPKTTKKSVGAPMDSNDIAGIIVDASGSIAQAVSKLVQNAAVAQSRRREAQKSQGTYYKQDPTWSNGLISAAKSVGGAVQMMIQAAIKATQGKAEEEELIATAREVAASTARLVSASRAKSGDDQQSQQAHNQLTLAAKAVTQAISKLLEAAKTATALQEEEEEQESETFNFTGSKIKELEQQMKILRLEKELNLERKRLLNSRKQAYNNNNNN